MENNRGLEDEPKAGALSDIARAADPCAILLDSATILEQIPDIVWVLDLKSLRFCYLSPSVASLPGWSTARVDQVCLGRSLSPESFSRAAQLVTDRIGRYGRNDPEALRPFTAELEILGSEGQVYPMETRVSFLVDASRQVNALLGVSRNLEPKAERERALLAKLEMEDTLYHELEHRVKNSLSIAASLLSLAGSRIGDKEAARVLQESHARLKALSLVYDHLRGLEPSGCVDLSEYLKKIADGLVEAFNSTFGIIELTTSCQECLVNTTLAISVGLIVNELIVNSIKHARPKAGPLVVELGVLRREGGSIIISVGDNGQGLPDFYTLKAGEGLGNSIIQSLVSQLKGRIEWTRSDSGGARFILEIPQVDGPGAEKVMLS